VNINRVWILWALAKKKRTIHYSTYQLWDIASTSPQLLAVPTLLLVFISSLLLASEP